MDRTTDGWLSGLLGVIIFSGSLPATRIAVQGMDPVFLTFARGGIAGLAALGCLLVWRAARPLRGDLVPLVVIALCVVLGFPLLSALALRQVTAAHALVFVGLLPMSTALFGVVRGGERPRFVFWAFALLGAAAVVGYALRNGIQGFLGGDGLMLAAVAVCGYGYAEGGRLSRRLGGWQVISWALVLSLPAMLPLAWWLRPAELVTIPLEAWAALGYVSLFSMLIGFVFWYRGLALGGIAGVGQLQLLQPFLGLMLAALLLKESVPASLLLVTLFVVACVAGARWSTHAAEPKVKAA